MQQQNDECDDKRIGHGVHQNNWQMKMMSKYLYIVQETLFV